MKAFQLIPSIAEYADFAALASEMHLGERDLILTNEYIYKPYFGDEPGSAVPATRRSTAWASRPT